MTVTKVTARLAEWITGLDGAAIPAEVRAEGVRTFVNWVGCAVGGATHERSEEHTSELQSLMRISYAVCCLKQKSRSDQPSRQAHYHQAHILPPRRRAHREQ